MEGAEGGDSGDGQENDVNAEFNEYMANMD